MIESGPELGGRLRASDHEMALRLGKQASDAGVEIRVATTAFGVFEHNLVAAAGPAGLVRLRPQKLVVATGGLEQPLLFGNSDLPGVMLSGAAERLVTLYRILPGEKAVVLTGDDRGYTTARTLVEARAQVTVLDWRADPTGPEVDAATKTGATVRKGFVPLRAEGGKRVRRTCCGGGAALRVRPRRDGGSDRPGLGLAGPGRDDHALRRNIDGLCPRQDR